MLRAFESAGAAGLFFSDQVFPNRCGYMAGKQVIPREEMIAKIKAALDARIDQDFFIAARTDAFAVEGASKAIERACLYKDAGADMAMVVGADSIESYQRVRREVPGPQFANMSHANKQGWAKLADYENAGAELVTFPSAALFAAAGAVTRAMAALLRDRSFDAVETELMPLDDYYDLVGLENEQAREATYAKEAEIAVKNARLASRS